jgi:hypothetical protein
MTKIDHDGTMSSVSSGSQEFGQRPEEEKEKRMLGAILNGGGL